MIKKGLELNSYFILLKLLILLPFLIIIIINNNIKFVLDKKNIRFIICNAPSHYHFGDEAILIATKEFLKTFFPHIEQIIIYHYEALYNIRLIKYIINKKDIIIINGGGYFGLYEHVIKAQTNIVNAFPNNHIIFFPCSIFYDPIKKDIYTTFLNIFNNHSSLTLFTRDNISYQTALYLFKNKNIYNIPDIVTRLNLNFLKKTYKRDGILLILRKDELLLTNEDRIYIKYLAEKYFQNNIFEKDSDSYNISFGSNRINETYTFINHLAQRQLVITDRLHGSIFSLITGTPCIVFGNNYHKVESFYDSWLKNIEYITFIKQKDIEIKLEENIKKYKNYHQNIIYDSNRFNQYYLIMKNIIQEKIDLINK